jgi:L-ascorbate metabolism protein UlaG (beta-lactamase superfamily)
MLTADLTFIGRASVKIKYPDGFTLYIDPYAGTSEDYKEPADLILVTHQHGDHNQVHMVQTKPDTHVIQCPMDITFGHTKKVGDTEVIAVVAYNKNHQKESCCGYVIKRQGLTLYHSGDTSNCPEMGLLAAHHIDYALLCMDGYYNMGYEEAMTVAKTIEAKTIIPIHTHKDDLYDAENDAKFTLENRLRIKPQETLTLR